MVKTLYEKGILKKRIQIKNRFYRRETEKRRKSKDWVYTDEEIKALDKACENDLERLQIRLGYLMGFRISDVCNLSWDRIILEGEIAFVTFGGMDDKGHFIGRCPMTSVLVSMLLKYPKKSKWVFPQEKNSDRHILIQQIDFEAIRVRAGVKRGTFHALRHYRLTKDVANPKLTFAHVSGMRRVSVKVLMEHYSHIRDEDMKLMIRETN